MPIDLFEVSGVDLLENKESSKKSISPMEQVSQFFGQLGGPTTQMGMGAAQGAAKQLAGLRNLGANALNMFPGMNIDTQRSPHFAPETGAAKAGEIGFDIGSFGIPGKAITEGVTSLPLGEKLLNKLLTKLEDKPVSKYLTNMLGRGAEGALVGALQSPESQLQGALLGGGLGSSTSALSQLVGSSNPLVRSLAQHSLGALTGYGAGEITGIGGGKGAAAGAVAPYALPKVFKELGVMPGNILPGQEGLRFIKEEEARPRVEAGIRLGTPLTPAEASGHPYIGRLEGGLGRVGEAAAERAEIGMENISKQRSAVNRLLDTIYDKTPISDNKVRSLYNTAYQWNLKPNVINALKEDPIIENAFREVSTDKAWQRKLQDVPENNYKYLDKVRKVISDEEGKLIKSGQKEKAAEFTAARNDLTGLMDKSNPSYEKARNEAQKSILRSQIQRKLKSTSIRGTDFYNKILKNPDEFKKLHDSLKNVPEAQNQLSDMRLAWEHLINIETPRSAAGKAEMNTRAARDAVTKIIDIYHEITGTKKQKQALKYIHSDQWINDLSDVVSKSKNKTEVNTKLADIIGRLVTSGTIAGTSSLRQ